MLAGMFSCCCDANPPTEQCRFKTHTDSSRSTLFFGCNDEGLPTRVWQIACKKCSNGHLAPKW